MLDSTEAPVSSPVLGVLGQDLDFAAWASGCLLFADDAASLASSGSDFGHTLERRTAECDALDCCGVLIKNIPSEEENLLALKNTHCYVENRQTCHKAAIH